LLVLAWESSAFGFISISLFILTHAFGFDSLRSKWNAPIFVSKIRKKKKKYSNAQVLYSEKREEEMRVILV
jgi:hypothetical protein